MEQRTRGFNLTSKLLRPQSHIQISIHMMQRNLRWEQRHNFTRSKGSTANGPCTRYYRAPWELPWPCPDSSELGLWQDHASGFNVVADRCNSFHYQETLLVYIQSLQFAFSTSCCRCNCRINYQLVIISFSETSRKSRESSKHTTSCTS